MPNFLKFASNSSLSNTDAARLSRVEEALPTSVAGRLTYSPSSLAVPSTNSVLSSGPIGTYGHTGLQVQPS